MLSLIEDEIQLYTRMAAEFKTKQGAWAQCVDSSIEFLSLVYEKLRDQGLKLGIDFGVMVDMSAPDWHQVFFIGEHKVDWTFRQFEVHTDFPRITKMIQEDLYNEDSGPIYAQFNNDIDDEFYTGEAYKIPQEIHSDAIVMHG